MPGNASPIVERSYTVSIDCKSGKRPHQLLIHAFEETIFAGLKSLERNGLASGNRSFNSRRQSNQSLLLNLFKKFIFVFEASAYIELIAVLLLNSAGDSLSINFDIVPSSHGVFAMP